MPLLLGLKEKLNLLLEIPIGCGNHGRIQNLFNRNSVQTCLKHYTVKTGTRYLVSQIVSLKSVLLSRSRLERIILAGRNR